MYIHFIILYNKIEIESGVVTILFFFAQNERVPQGISRLLGHPLFGIRYERLRIGLLILLGLSFSNDPFYSNKNPPVDKPYLYQSKTQSRRLSFPTKALPPNPGKEYSKH